MQKSFTDKSLAYYVLDHETKQPVLSDQATVEHMLPIEHVTQWTAMYIFDDENPVLISMDMLCGAVNEQVKSYAPLDESKFSGHIITDFIQPFMPLEAGEEMFFRITAVSNRTGRQITEYVRDHEAAFKAHGEFSRAMSGELEDEVRFFKGALADPARFISEEALTADVKTLLTPDLRNG